MRERTRLDRHRLAGRLLAPLLALVLAQAAHATQASDAEWGVWYLLSPFDHPPGSSSIAESYGPETDLETMRAGGLGPDLARAYEGQGGETIRWEALLTRHMKGTEADQAKIDLQALTPRQTDRAVAYLYRRIEARRACSVRVLMGSDDGMRLWFNGKLRIDSPVPRGVVVGDERLTLELHPGVNHLLVKVCNGGGAWGFQLVYQFEIGEKARAELQPRINQAIDRGVEYVLEQQHMDGSWGYLPGQYRNGQTSLSVYTLLKSGVSPDHHAIQRALQYLSSRPPIKTYSASCQLMALAATKRDAYLDWMQGIAEDLLDWQSGSWGYPLGNLDLSNTQYAALGLRAAAQRGISIPSKAWDKLGAHALSYQAKDSGFGYHPGSRATGSMTAAGVSVLCICLEQIGGDGPLSPRRRKAMETACDEGVSWLAEHFSVHSNPQPHASNPNQRWLEYYLYGLERVGALTGLERFGQHDWYWTGASLLVGAQGDEGQWATAYGESEPNTCFALLFLQRATAPTSGQSSTRRSKRYGVDDPEVAVSLMASGDSPLTVWVSSFGDQARRDWEWAEDEGDGPRVARVRYLVGGETIAVVEGDRGVPAGISRYPIQHRFASPGTYAIIAQVEVVRPGASDEDPPGAIQSPPLEVRIEEVVEPWMIEYATDSTRNELSGARVEVSSSSQHSGGWKAANAIDDRAATGWLCAKDDEERTIELALRRPVRANTLILSHARPKPESLSHAGRASLVELVLDNRKTPFRIELDPEDPGKTTWSFQRTESIRNLKLRILAFSEGTDPGVKMTVGFAEIELQNRPRDKKD